MRKIKSTVIPKILLLSVIVILLIAFILNTYLSAIPSQLTDSVTKTDAIVVLTGSAGRIDEGIMLIKEGLAKLTEAGVTDVLAVPAMLFAAGHAKNDIPSVLNRYQAEHKELTIHYGSELGLDTKMTRAAGERIQEALADNPSDIDTTDTLLMVVGRGSSDPDANSNVSKLTRQLC